jgi:hypothetical protein
MIILEEVAERPKDDTFNGLTLRNPQAAYTRSSSLLLPDYDTSEAQRHQGAIPPSSKFKLDAKTWRSALFFVLGLYILTVIIAVPIVLKYKDAKNNRPEYPPAIPVWSTVLTLPPPYRMSSGVPSSNLNCNHWQTDPNTRNSVMASFQLPPTDYLTISSNATYDSITPAQLNGTLSVSMNSNPDESSILFTVEMQSSSQYIQDKTTVCFNEQGPNTGLSIFIPSNIDDGTLALHINVVLPQVNSTISSFTTSLPMFSQDFADLRQYLSFNQFNLQGSHRPINCNFLQAQQISVTNTLAHIQGSFNVTDSLYLDSIKGPIISDIILSPRPGLTQPTMLSLVTGNSTINASITLNALVDTLIPVSSPVFVAQVQNFDGPLQLDVAYDNASLPSPFQLKVQNNGAPSIISMDHVFQGRFDAQTKLSKVLVYDNTQKTPSRTFETDAMTSSMVMGWVGWGKKVASPSCVDIVSALGPINLIFGP